MLKVAGKQPRKSATERVLRLSMCSPARGFSRAVVIGGGSFPRSSSGLGFTSAVHRSFVSSSVATWSPPGTQAAPSSPAPLRFKAQVASIPHPEKVFKGGEDASFVSDDGHAIGVFDGVGGWAGTGVDPAVYSRSLASECAAAHKQTGSRSPKELLERAWLNSQRITGSSTACCVTLHGSTLRGANVGDSGFLVVRQGALFYRQEEQQHGFNFPFQLGTGSTDSPNDADCVELELEPGDVVVASTDGVGDNLFPEEIVSIVCEGLTLGKSETEMAARIAQVASSRANSTAGRSPFAVNAKQCGYEYSGGKLDDITVVVAIVEASAKL